MRERFVAIQMLRAVAAVAVVMHHVSGQLIENMGIIPFLSFYKMGGRGVELFFAISGFIIFYAHYHQLSNPKFMKPYILRRLIRILPSTFVIATGWLVVVTVAKRVGIQGPDISFETWLSSAFVLPMLDMPSPGTIWTLRNEFVFYGVFCIFLYNARLGAAVFATWLGACFIVPVPGSLGGLREGIFFNTVLSDINTIFAFGNLAFLGHHHFPNARAGYAILPLCIIFCYLSYYDVELSGIPPYAFGIVAGLLVYSAAQVQKISIFGNTLELLGDASYAIYLVHVPVIAILYPGLAKMALSANLIYFIETVVSVAIGVLFYKLFETPVARFFAKRRRKGALQLGSQENP